MDVTVQTRWGECDHDFHRPDPERLRHRVRGRVRGPGRAGGRSREPGAVERPRRGPWSAHRAKIKVAPTFRVWGYDSCGARCRSSRGAGPPGDAEGQASEGLGRGRGARMTGGTAYRMLFRVAAARLVQPAMGLLVWEEAPGGLGSLAVRRRQRGRPPVAWSSSDEKGEYAKSLGAVGASSATRDAPMLGRAAGVGRCPRWKVVGSRREAFGKEPSGGAGREGEPADRVRPSGAGRPDVSFSSASAAA